MIEVKSQGDVKVFKTTIVDIVFKINSAFVEVEIKTELRDGGEWETDYKILSRSDRLTDEELDELDDYINSNY